MLMLPAKEAESERRSPCGERGLKYPHKYKELMKYGSLPVRGAWIEMLLKRWEYWEEQASLPVRGAWIEIQSCEAHESRCLVAPRAGSVD